MKISTEIGSASALLGEERAIESVARAGFDAWDFSMTAMCRYRNRAFKKSSHPLAGDEYLAFAHRLKQVGLDNGIHCNQSHAPFPVYCPEIRSYLKRAIECTAEAGGNICIVHPDNYKEAEENAELYLELLPFAKECGVKIAAENMWLWDSEKDQVRHAACMSPSSFCAHIDAVGDDFLVACLDIGHAEMRGTQTSAVEMIKALGHRLQALHIHDNDKWKDLHQIPFSMNIDFEAVIRALKEIGYSGYLTLEAKDHLKAYTAENAEEGIIKLAESAKKLVEMWDK